jgi:hypothetical protein
MNKKGVIGAGVLIVLLIVIGGILYQVFTVGLNDDQKERKRGSERVKIEDEKEGFEFEAKSINENTWEYEIEGELPSPCHTASVQALVLESYPEQVSVILKITPPDQDTMCTTVLKEFEDKGTFSASEKAKVSFSVTVQ